MDKEEKKEKVTKTTKTAKTTDRVTKVPRDAEKPHVAEPIAPDVPPNRTGLVATIIVALAIAALFFLFRPYPANAPRPVTPVSQPTTSETSNGIDTTKTQ